MLQIRNADKGRSQWNVSEAHIIIPMIDGDSISSKKSDKILASTITLNALEGSEQTILPSGLEHGLVLGVDKSLFESSSFKSDLLVIQNSDLKLLPCNTDVKVAYTLSNTQQEKSEIIWQNSSTKDRIFASDKAIFEVRQIINYDNVNLEKNNEQISSQSLPSNVTSQVAEPDKEVLLEEKMNQEKNIGDSQFIINYNPGIDSSKETCIQLNTEVSKTTENIKDIENKKLFQSQIPTNSSVGGPSYRLGENFEEIIFNTSNMVSCSDTTTFSILEFSKLKTDKKEEELPKNSKITKDSKAEEDKSDTEISDSFPEKNWPLKKKSKIKKTLMAQNFGNQRSLLKANVFAAQEYLKFPTGVKVKQIVPNNLQEKKCLDNSGFGHVKDKMKKQNKIKLKSLHKNFPMKEMKKNSKKSYSVTGNEIGDTQVESFDFDKTKFRNIFDLIECLRKYEMIDLEIWKILNSGLKEIKVDILKEMNAKRKTNSALESSSYSTQLKAFALVLYFKQPAAFNYLLQTYKNGWPSLNVIKEWKQRMNASHRQNFLRAQSEPENSKL